MMKPALLVELRDITKSATGMALFVLVELGGRACACDRASRSGATRTAINRHMSEVMWAKCQRFKVPVLTADEPWHKEDWIMFLALDYTFNTSKTYTWVQQT
jgi:hypothetical protein